MGFRLKSGLGKTVIYQAVSQYVPESFLPTLQKCYFKRKSNNYCLKFFGDGYSYEVDFSVYDNGVHVRLIRVSCLDDDNSVLSVIFSDVVSFDYLLSHNMLRYVS